MVSQRRRMASSSTGWKRALSRDGLSFSLLAVPGSMVTPSSGVNSTATAHEIRSAAAITANSVKVYSPAELPFSPIGTKPATVTSVPVSMGKAVEL